MGASGPGGGNGAHGENSPGGPVPERHLRAVDGQASDRQVSGRRTGDAADVPGAATRHNDQAPTSTAHPASTVHPATASPVLDTDDQRRLRSAYRGALWVGLLIPLLITAAAVTTTLIWLPRLPDPAATHWSGGDGPDGFGPGWTFPLIGALLGIVIPGSLWAFARFGARGASRPRWSAMQRGLVAFGLGATVSMQGLLLTCVGVQLDVPDARDAPGVDAQVALSFIAWVVATVLGWFAQPKVRLERDSEPAAAPLELGAEERAVWVRDARGSGVFIAVMIGTLLLMSAAAVWTWTLGSEVWWVNALLAVFVAAAGLTCCAFRVRADARGLEVRAVVGWPVFRVPADDIESVTATRIAPLADFGGWGLRWAPGRVGVVLSAGEGIMVRRRDGGVFAVTVDDADTGAALLAAAAARSHESADGGSIGAPDGRTDPDPHLSAQRPDRAEQPQHPAPTPREN